MDDFVMPLMLGLDISSLTMSLVNIASASGSEAALADSIDAALRTLAHLQVERDGDTVVARTDAGHSERVVVVGHLDAAPSVDDPLAYVEMGRLFGPGASDAKGALAMMLKAASAGGHRCDVTFVFHAGGLGSAPWPTDDVPADARTGFVLLAEPTDAAVVGGALDHPQAVRLAELAETEPTADDGRAHGLARLAALGVPAVAFGPGDPSVAGTPDEFVPTAQLSQCDFVLRQWLTA